MVGYVEPLTGLGRGDVDRAGGKGANLGELVRAGFPVPVGFVVTTEAYRAFVEANGLAGAILALATRPAPDQAAVEETAGEIRRLFAGGAIPDPLRQEIVDAYDRLGHECAVAVRSSATAEDLAEASFAGQQDTYLNVRGHGRPAGGGARLLGVAVDGAGDGLPRPAADRPRRRCASPWWCRRWSPPTPPG